MKEGGTMQVQACLERDQDQSALDAAAEIIYRWLAACLRDPGPEQPLHAFDAHDALLVSEAARLLRDEFKEQTIALGFGELPIEELDPEKGLRILASADSDLLSEYRRVFGLNACRECPPYETEFFPNDEPFFRSQQMADLAGFYRAFGLQISSMHRDRPDHIGTQLEFAALLLTLGQAASTGGSIEVSDGRIDVCREARRSFVRDHLAWWASSFALALRKHAGDGFYAEVARILSAFLPLERHRLGIAPPKMPLEAKSDDLLPILSETEGCLR